MACVWAEAESLVVGVERQNSPDLLCAAIIAEARGESDRILEHARHEADALLAKADVDAKTLRQERLTQARAEAVRRSELVLATVPLESGRLRSRRVDGLLESIREELQQRLRAGHDFDVRESVVALVAAALQRMDGSAFVIRVAESDRAALGDRLSDAIARRVGLPALDLKIVSDATLRKGDGIIEDLEGRQIWDNRLEARLRRLWPELRRQIAVQSGLTPGSESGGGAV